MVIDRSIIGQCHAIADGKCSVLQNGQRLVSRDFCVRFKDGIAINLSRTSLEDHAAPSIFVGLSRYAGRDNKSVAVYFQSYITLRLGRLPYSTCLSYVDGQYRECLLSSFDSNKKILLAKKNGKVIGRAVIRLTKGRDYLRDDVDAPTLEFADLTKPPEKRYEDERPADQLTLFLERPYFKNANYSETAVIKQMFISLVRKKAMQMLATPVLAICYEEQCAASDFVRMRYALYISKSKGGAQYLDSLDGQVKVSREGSFKAFPFLVLPSNEMAAIS